MSRVFKWMGYLVGGLLVLVVALAVYVYLITDTRLSRVYQVQAPAIPIPTDPASIERGRHLVTTIGFCSECHGINFAGDYFDSGPLIGALRVPNLTTGKGGIGASFSDQDYVRAIRYGLRSDGRSLIEMPSNHYFTFSDQDLGAMVAFIKSLPPVDKEMPPTSLGLMARLYMLMVPEMLPAEHIEFNAPRPPSPPPGPTADYGRYLAIACVICHEQDLAGSSQPGGGVNLTPGGELANWSEADFFKAMRYGQTPSGRSLDPNLMPWPRISLMNDMELRAIWLYLQSVPPVKDPPFLHTPTPPPVTPVKKTP
jgi:mono/diheme cytochrome c family protein